MIKKFMQFRKTDVSNEAANLQAENEQGGAGNAETSGANDEAQLAQGAGNATTEQAQPAQNANAATQPLGAESARQSTGFETSTSTGGGVQDDAQDTGKAGGTVEEPAQ